MWLCVTISHKKDKNINVSQPCTSYTGHISLKHKICQTCISNTGHISLNFFYCVMSPLIPNIRFVWTLTLRFVWGLTVMSPLIPNIRFVWTLTLRLRTDPVHCSHSPASEPQTSRRVRPGTPAHSAAGCCACRGSLHRWGGRSSLGCGDHKSPWLAWGCTASQQYPRWTSNRCLKHRPKEFKCIMKETELVLRKELIT